MNSVGYSFAPPKWICRIRLCSLFGLVLLASVPSLNHVMDKVPRHHARHSRSPPRTAMDEPVDKRRQGANLNIEAGDNAFEALHTMGDLEDVMDL